MKIGRNAPCPCGSGKKYKKCCLDQTVVQPQELYYRRLSEAHDQLVDRLVKHAGRIFGEEAVYVAMHEFLLWPEADDEISEEMLDRAGALFWPWFVFNWEYNRVDAEVELSGPEGLTVAELYAEERGDKLDTLERRLIEGINRKPYSFLEVVSIDRGRGMALRDTLKGDRTKVQERSGSQYVQSGDLLFGRAVDVDGVGMLVGLGQTLIPPGHKPDIIQFRKRMRGDTVITDDTLYDWDVEIRQLYYDIDRALHTAPQLCNTDGDALEFHRLIYEVSSTEVAFGKLEDLCATMTPEEMVADARHDEAGGMVRVEMHWDRLGHKQTAGLPNTILGRIIIEGQRLIAEVNSAERAKTLRRELDTRLGDAGRFKVDEIQDLDAMMRHHAAEFAENTPSAEHEELMQYPEVQAQVAKMFSRHWESWPDLEIPALGGISPREAIKTPDGREAVEALLEEAERGHGQDDVLDAANRDGARRVRELLDLKRR